MSDQEDAKQVDLEQEWDWIFTIKIMQSNLCSACNILDSRANLNIASECIERTFQMAKILRREMKTRLERDTKNEN